MIDHRMLNSLRDPFVLAMHSTGLDALGALISTITSVSVFIVTVHKKINGVLLL